MLYRKLERGRLYQSIIDEVEGYIISGKLKPGDLLPPERELAERFGVSRTAVREAVKVLSEKGLLDVQQGRGAMVKHHSYDMVVNSLTLCLKLDRSDAQQLLEVRMGLEPEMAALAAERADEVQVDELRRLASELRRRTDDDPEAVQLDLQFHDLIQESAQNSVGRAMLLSIRGALQELIRSSYALEHESVPRTAQEHSQIVDAIAAREPVRAASAMRKHLVAVAEHRGIRLRLSTES